MHPTTGGLMREWFVDRKKHIENGTKFMRNSSEKYNLEDALSEAEKIKELVGRSGSSEDYKVAHDTVVELELDRDHDPQYLERISNKKKFEEALARGDKILPIKGSVIEDVLFKNRPQLKIFKVVFDSNSKFSIEIEEENVFLTLTNADYMTTDFRMDFKSKKLVGDSKDYPLSDAQITEIKRLIERRKSA